MICLRFLMQYKNVIISKMIVFIYEFIKKQSKLFTLFYYTWAKFGHSLVWLRGFLNYILYTD